MSWLVPREELTVEQLRAVELDPHEHRVVVGPPGSGKTQILLHRAAYLRERYNVPPERFRVMVFTNVLKRYLESDLTLLDLPAECVSTFDSWCAEQYLAHVGKRLPWNAREKCRDFHAIRRAVHQRATSLLAEPQFDFVLVDEGQDLGGEVFETLRAAARHVTVCLDRKQQLYDEGSEEADILKALGIRRRNVGFLDAFRCCPYIVRMAASLVDDPEEGRAYLRQVRAEQVERETPLLYYSSGFEDEKDRLIEVLHARLSKGERVGILLAQKRQVFGFAKGLREAGVEVETQRDRARGDSPDDVVDFGNERPKLLTYHSAKGLTFDSVLLPRLVPTSFKGMSSSRVNRLLFVGITRAVTWVYMSTSEDTDFRPLTPLLPLAKAGFLTVQGARRQKPLFDESERGPGAGEEPPDLF